MKLLLLPVKVALTAGLIVFGGAAATCMVLLSELIDWEQRR